MQPEEVERALREFPRVSDVRVFGMDDPVRGERLVACLVVSGNRPSTLELRTFCAGRLAAHKIPRVFVFVDEIPLTRAGRPIDRGCWRSPAQRWRVPVCYSPGST